MHRFRAFRLFLLLLLFAGTAFYAKTQKLHSRSWAKPLQVIIYPINGENSRIVDQFIKELDVGVFTEIEHFFQREGEHYDLPVTQPFSFKLGEMLTEHPPVSPAPGANPALIAWWGIKFRYWAFRHTPDNKSNLHRIRVFLHYHETVPGKKLQHSLGLDKGLLAVVHAFASKQQNRQNNIVIAHELLHTVGAVDKYDHAGNPVFPQGYVDPQKIPLYPQNMAEIMAAQIPLTKNKSLMAESLDQCLIGSLTAKEINWTQ